MTDSRVSGLYRLNVQQRIAKLRQLGWLSAEAASRLQAGRQVLSVAMADNMVENVIGVFGLPLAVAPNFLVNQRDCIVPLVVEEPSIVAALSNAAAMARHGGGFKAELQESLLIGQIHVSAVEDPLSALARLSAAKSQLLRSANEVHPRLLARGGGVRDIELRQLQLDDGAEIIAVHLLVDTCDAMGANLVNTLCESVAPQIAEICQGDVALRILSNLVDRSVCSASVKYPVETLTNATLAGEQVRDRIVLASKIAAADPYRAATHNKGVMNGIDALAIATGNDWRAIEAGAHAYAARSGRYASLTAWSVAPDGALLGEIEVPLKPGIVGGTLKTNQAAEIGLAIAATETAAELAQLMAAVGLAQNFAALRALATSGIQEGHMRLHARSVAAAAGAPPDRIDEVVAALIASGEIKDWKAQEIVERSRRPDSSDDTATATAAGKVILLGEHAVVYGRHALAVPIANAVRASAVEAGTTTVTIRDWQLHEQVDVDASEGLAGAVNLILRELGLQQQGFEIQVSSDLPRGIGLGSSAALVVAITRAVASCAGLSITDDAVNDIAFACEKIAHGTPSGVDNTLSCFAQPLLFRNSDGLHVETLEISTPPPLVIAYGEGVGLTNAMVAGVRSRFEENPDRFNAIFDQIDEYSIAGARALCDGHYEALGQLLNLCHGLLNAIGVTTPELEQMVAIARKSGAVGAKLTGAGGGGSVVALCPGSEDSVRSALHKHGFKTLLIQDIEESQT